jgi:hypothetical protein
MGRARRREKKAYLVVSTQAEFSAWLRLAEGPALGVGTDAKRRITIALEAARDAEPWVVQERTLVVASDGRLRLDGCFYGGTATSYPPGALGRAFYATPGEAVAAYERAAADQIEVAKARLAQAQAHQAQVVAWAERWRVAYTSADESSERTAGGVS